MRSKNFKGRCVKKKYDKCDEICRTYDNVQRGYAELLQENDDIVQMSCNVLLNGLDYTTDFVCVKKNGDLMVRECIYRSMIEKPKTIMMLDISREYWRKYGVKDWGLVINADEK